MDRLKEIQIHLGHANRMMAELVKEGYRVEANINRKSVWASTGVPIAEFTVEVWQKV